MYVFPLPPPTPSIFPPVTAYYRSVHEVYKNVSRNTFPNIPLNLFNNILSQFWFVMMKEDLTSKLRGSILSTLIG